MIPLMLYLEIHPRVASSTSAFNYSFLAMSNLITLLVGKLLPINEVLLYSILAVNKNLFKIFSL